MPLVQILHNYQDVVLLHKYFGFALAGSFLFWVFYYLVTGGLKKHYLMGPQDIKSMPRQVLYYVLHIFKGEENPFTPSTGNKFNPLQKLVYSTIMFIVVPVITASGILFSDILFFFSWIKAMGGLRILNAIHVAAAYVLVLYLLIHLYMSTLGPKFYSHIKGMITGYEE